MFVSVLSLCVLLMSTVPEALTMLQPSGIQTLSRVSIALESAVYRTSGKANEEKSGRSVKTKRFDDYSPYSSNPYDGGPIDMCSYPQIDVCDFPAGYTVPEYSARALSRLNDVFTTMKDNLIQLDGPTCATSVMNMMCKYSVIPQCVSNTTVRYPGNLMEVSNKLSLHDCDRRHFVRTRKSCPYARSAARQMDGSARRRCRTRAISTGLRVRSHSLAVDHFRELDSSGFCSVAEGTLCYRREVNLVRGGFNFHCTPRANGLASCFRLEIALDWK